MFTFDTEPCKLVTVNKIMRIILILMSVVVLGGIFNQGYTHLMISSYELGCTDAALKLKQDYGSEYGLYMRTFCNARINMIRKEYHLEDK